MTKPVHTHPKISIVMPTLNQGDYIEAAILSILHQNYPNLQFIVIDGGSTDDTLKILEKYSSKIDVIVSEKDNGQSDAINKGLQYCNGELFNWLNSDDLLSEMSLFHISEIYLHTQSDVIIAKTQAFFEDGKNILNQTSKLVSPPFAITSLMSQQSTFYNTSMIKELGGINEKLHYCMDWELWIRFTAIHGIQNIGYTDRTLGKFRIHSSSKSTISLLKFDADKTAVALAILNELDSKSYQEIIKYINPAYYTKDWEIKHEYKNLYHALALEVILDRNSKSIPSDIFTKYFFKSLGLATRNRWRFMVLPLRLFARKLF